MVEPIYITNKISLVVYTKMIMKKKVFKLFMEHIRFELIY